jgi:hypothetical protein
MAQTLAASSTAPGRASAPVSFSRILRRVHMYLGLFLAPWLLMYALSTIVMNHRAMFRDPAASPAIKTEFERSWAGVIAPDAKPPEIASQVLKDLRLEGFHTVNATPNGRRITILRQDPITPRRIIFTPEDGKLIVQKQEFRMPGFLERLHRRRGYQSEFFLQSMWALSVDLVILAIVFWGISGLWLWWEMRRTRFLGGVLFCSGCVLFMIFLLRI